MFSITYATRKKFTGYAGRLRGTLRLAPISPCRSAFISEAICTIKHLCSTPGSLLLPYLAGTKGPCNDEF